MNRQLLIRGIRSLWPLMLLAALPGAASAQVAVPDIEEIHEVPAISAAEIEEIIGPIALYPDDLLAIVLPASTFPLQIVEAGRFLDDLEDDPSLEPDPDWDDSIVALLNYPEVVELLNEDLDWTWRLGEAVVGQQSDVIAAIENFRDRAYAAGNLKTDDYQLVAEEEGAISITPVQEDVIYVPYYEPEEVVVYQPRRVYYYYPRAYPVYYYPYPSSYAFQSHFYNPWFWGVTTAFSIGWQSHHLNVYHHSFYGHPYYGHTYRDRWWYRRPNIHVYNNVYVRRNYYTNVNRYRDGDRWLPSDRRTVNSNRQITRTRYYPNSRSDSGGNASSYSNTNRAGQVARSSASPRLEGRSTWRSEREPIEFRKRSSSGSVTPPRTTTAKPAPTRESRPDSVTLRPSLQRDSRDTAYRGSQQPRVTATRPSQPRASSGSATRQPAARPSSSSRQSAARPSSSSRQSASRPSSPSRQPAARPSSSSRQPAARPQSSRQPASRPSSSSRKSASTSGGSRRSDGSNKRPDKK